MTAWCPKSGYLVVPGGTARPFDCSCGRTIWTTPTGKLPAHRLPAKKAR